MNTHFSNILRLGVLALCGLISGSVMADHAEAVVSGHVDVQLDARHNHNRYYPRTGVAVRVLPRAAYVTRYHGSPYYFHGGIWYRHAGPRYIVVRPPLGAFITVLPPFYSTVWFGGIPYYYADNVYYRWDADQRGYIVAPPPDGSPYSESGDNDAATSDATSAAAASDDLYIYPKKGQSEEQQSTDRYECHRWAADQTGFDPTKSQGGVDGNEIDSKRADYQRAQTACLEARDYSVK